MVRPIDRRVQKTKGLLHGALAALIHEKSFDGVVVKEILARANVGRATFYSHYRDKEELLDAGIREMLRKCVARGDRATATAEERVLRFSLPLLEHIGGYPAKGPLAGEVKRQAHVHERLEATLAEWLVGELQQLRRRSGVSEQPPVELLAEHVASTFVLVLDRWLASEVRADARSANTRFLALILPVLNTVSAS